MFSGHVHNYEHQEHNGVTYFVTGGGGARPYPIERTPDDPGHGKSVLLLLNITSAPDR
jgi:hypothetical protein